MSAEPTREEVMAWCLISDPACKCERCVMERAAHALLEADAARIAELEALVERLREGFELLLPGLILDLRYADADDDKDAMRSRIDTVNFAQRACSRSLRKAATDC